MAKKEKKEYFGEKPAKAEKPKKPKARDYKAENAKRKAREAAKPEKKRGRPPGKQTRAVKKMARDPMVTVQIPASMAYTVGLVLGQSQAI